MGEPEPTGAFIVMVALAEVPRNAEGAQREGRANGEKSAAKGIAKAGAPIRAPAH
jgi:hypothetical protein